MSQEITLNHFVHWLQRYGEYIDTQENYLSELDAAIGDADHGANMARGSGRRRDNQDADPSA